MEICIFCNRYVEIMMTDASFRVSNKNFSSLDLIFEMHVKRSVIALPSTVFLLWTIFVQRDFILHFELLIFIIICKIETLIFDGVTSAALIEVMLLWEFRQLRTQKQISDFFHIWCESLVGVTVHHFKFFFFIKSGW